MDEYINLNDINCPVRDEEKCRTCPFYGGVWCHLKEVIHDMPIIDIVYCKDCKYSGVDKMGWYCNKHYHRYADENTHFCSDGRKE